MWIVRVSYEISDTIGTDDTTEAAIERIADEHSAAIGDTGSGMGMRDLEIETVTEDQAETVAAAIENTLPDAFVSVRNLDSEED